MNFSLRLKIRVWFNKPFFGRGERVSGGGAPWQGAASAGEGGRSPEASAPCSHLPRALSGTAVCSVRAWGSPRDRL